METSWAQFVSQRTKTWAGGTGRTESGRLMSLHANLRIACRHLHVACLAASVDAAGGLGGDGAVCLPSGDCGCDCSPERGSSRCASGESATMVTSDCGSAVWG